MCAKKLKPTPDKMKMSARPSDSLRSELGDMPSKVTDKVTSQVNDQATPDLIGELQANNALGEASILAQPATPPYPSALETAPETARETESSIKHAAAKDSAKSLMNTQAQEESGFTPQTLNDEVLADKAVAFSNAAAPTDSAENLENTQALRTEIARNLQEFQAQSRQFMQQGFDQSLVLTGRLMAAKSLPEVISLQQAFFRQQGEALLSQMTVTHKMGAKVSEVVFAALRPGYQQP